MTETVIGTVAGGHGEIIRVHRDRLAPMLQPTTRANAHIQSQSLLGGSAFRSAGSPQSSDLGAITASHSIQSFLIASFTVCHDI